ncbi:MAG TPA: hypothetical protein VFR02_07250, partial [bacterium]|nr:hypothetical protein [bacterium]
PSFTFEAVVVSTEGSCGISLNPMMMALGPEGNVYVTDQGNRYVVFDPTSTPWAFIHECGSFGSASGQFSLPIGIGVDAARRVYVSDDLNNRVERFLPCLTQTPQPTCVPTDTPTVTFTPSPASPSPTPSPSLTPTVTITPTPSPAPACGYQGSLVLGSQGTGFGQLESPFDEATDPSGRIYVVDGQNRVTEWSPLPAPVAVATWTLPAPTGGVCHLAADANHLYVSSQGSDTIQILNLPSGTPVGPPLGGPGTGAGQFDSLWGIAVDAAGDIYAADNGNGRVEKFTAPGYAPSVFVDNLGAAPTGVGVDSQGNVFVSDGTGRVRKYDPSGTLQGTIAGPGIGTDPMGNFSFDLAVDGCDRVDVLDTNNNRVLVYGPGGAPLLA